MRTSKFREDSLVEQLEFVVQLLVELRLGVVKVNVQQSA